MNIKRDAWGYGCMICFSLSLLFWIIPTWTPPWPGYGMPADLVPKVAAWFILLLAALGLGRNLLILHKERASAQKATCDKEESAATRPGWLHLLIYIVPCALFMPAVALCGFIPAGIVFLLIIEFLCGQRKPVPMICVSVLPVAVVWALMRYVLNVPLP